MPKGHMYRVEVLAEPEWEDYTAFDNRDMQQEHVAWRRPVGWVPSEGYVSRFGTTKYFEPDTSKWYRSRSSAKNRADLLNSFGYLAIVQRSAPVVWPSSGCKFVESSEATRVVDAIKTLIRAGLIRSADDVLGG